MNSQAGKSNPAQQVKLKVKTQVEESKSSPPLKSKLNMGHRVKHEPGKSKSVLQAKPQSGASNALQQVKAQAGKLNSSLQVRRQSPLVFDQNTVALGASRGFLSALIEASKREINQQSKDSVVSSSGQSGKHPQTIMPSGGSNSHDVKDAVASNQKHGEKKLGGKDSKIDASHSLEEKKQDGRKDNQTEQNLSCWRSWICATGRFNGRRGHH